MALSRPLLGVQSPIQCQLFQQCAKISWKCLECDLLMCSSCKNNVHHKIKTDKEHRIIDIKEIGARKVSVDLNVVEVFQTNFEYVSRLAVSLDDSMWIGEGEYKKGIKLFGSHTGLQKVKTIHKLQVISSFNIQADSIAMTPNNDLLIPAEGTILKQIKNQASKITDSVFDCQPYKTLAVHVTSKYKVIVGIWDEKGNTNQVWVLNSEGNQERVYGDDRTKDITFNYLSKITDTSNDNIFVVDYINQELEGYVKVLGLDNVINTYYGNSVINTKDKPFTRSSLATTPSDNVIIADIDRHVVHILNSSGELITYINTFDQGIEGPHSICLTMAGQFCTLYIGTTSKIDRKGDGKLYKLDITGI